MYIHSCGKTAGYSGRCEVKNYMFGLGTKELIILAGIIVLLFGSKKIADLARSVAEAVKILRGSFRDEKDTTDKKN